MSAIENSSRRPPRGTLWALGLTFQFAFLVAIVGALAVTLAATPTGVRVLAVGLVAPIIALTLVCLRLSWRASAWGFGGAAALGAFGVGLRLVISTRPSLEVGGGLPLWVTVLYVILGTMVCLTSAGCALQIRRTSPD